MSKTERLYYNDSLLLEFDASVVATESLKNGYGIVLDRTAFYPTSGGQPNDLGTLNGVSVLDVYENESTGVVTHVVEKPLEMERVHGSVDRQRRQDHMQQHSGQHVLSQAFVELFQWPTVSFHLGAVMSTIDLAVESMTWDHAVRAEARANAIIEENKPVAVCYFDSQNLAEVGLRKPTARSGEVRIIDMGGFDKSACGGTHVRSTGEIGPILITRIERMKKQVRLEFLCGGRVLRYARQANRTLDSISQVVSAPPLESAPAVRAIWDDLQRSRKQIADLESRLLDIEASSFPVTDGFAIAAFKNRGVEAIKMLALKISERPGLVVLLADESDQIRVVFARSADRQTDVAAILKVTLEKFGGRGGGKPTLAQAGGLTAGSASEILEFARSHA